MTGTMATRPRITIDIEERHKRAFMLFAAAKGMSAPQAFAAVVESQMAEYLAIADKNIAEESAPKPAVKKPKA
jgi:hypothetical protein